MTTFLFFDQNKAKILTENSHICNFYKKCHFSVDQKDKNHIHVYYVSVKLKDRSENLEKQSFLPFLTHIGPKFLLHFP